MAVMPSQYHNTRKGYYRQLQLSNCVNWWITRYNQLTILRLESVYNSIS